MPPVTPGHGTVAEPVTITPQIDTTSFADVLTTALDAFHRALTRRWRDQVCEAVVDAGTYPIVLRRTGETPVYPTPQWWDYTTMGARAHLTSMACAFVDWVRDGQRTPLQSVTCQGFTYALPSDQTMPAQINCGLGRLLAQVEDWAWDERNHIFEKLPLFDRHDLRAIEQAYAAVSEVAGHLGLNQAAPGFGEGGDAPSQPTGPPLANATTIPAIVHGLAGADSDGQSWWSNWTGLAAASVRNGFFASVSPSMNNQALIAGYLANLYSGRAAIIVMGRNNALSHIQQATAALDATELVESPITIWKVATGAGLAVSVGAGWSGGGAVAGSALQLVGFLGETLADTPMIAVPAHDIEVVVGEMNDRVDDLNLALANAERDQQRAVGRLQRAIHGVASENLELYDLTRNRPGGVSDPNPGFTAEIDAVLRIAERSFRAADLHEDLLPLMIGTEVADPHLAGQDGQQTPADRDLLEVREQLYQFLRTSCGRYLLAADQVHAAAAEYAETEEVHRSAFREAMAEWEAQGTGNVDVDLDPAEAAAAAEATDRSDYDPYEGNPVLAGSPPPDGQDDGYLYEDTPPAAGR